MKNNVEDEIFSTQDIPVIAFLIANNHKIIKQSHSSYRATFAFKKTKHLLEDLYNYGNNANIPVQTFYRNLSQVWSLIKQEKRKNG